MTSTRQPLREPGRWLGRIGALAVASLTLTACLADSGEDGDTAAAGGGVEAGATKDEYIAAFEDVEPIELTTQAPSGPGELQSLHIEEYAEALNEWSGGKITMEIAYGNAVAPPDQAPQALADGRLDFDYFYTVYDPSRFPANGDALANASFLGDHSPVVGTLGAIAGYLEVGLDTPEIMAEPEAEGVKLLLPYGPTTSYGLMCKEPRNSLDDLRGVQVRVGGTAFAQQSEALGMSPVSLPYSEIFQALERGTIDCALQATWAALTLGTVPLAPNYTLDADAGFARLFFGLATGKDTWDQLPLVAQQLMYDRLDVYIETMLQKAIWESVDAAAKIAEENNGVFEEFDDDVEKVLTDFNESMLDKTRDSSALDGQALIDDLTAALDHWGTVVEDDLGYPAVTDAEFTEWFDDGDIDLEPYMTRLREDVLSKHRPG